MTGKKKKPGETVIREIKRKTRRQFTAEEKIRIVIDGLRGEDLRELLKFNIIQMNDLQVLEIWKR